MTAKRAVVSVSLSRDEFDRIAGHCDRHGLRVSAYLRDSALAQTSPTGHVLSVSGDNARGFPPAGVQTVGGRATFTPGGAA